MTPRCVCGHSSTSHGRWGADPCNAPHCSCKEFQCEPLVTPSPSPVAAVLDAAEVHYAGMQAVRDMPFDWYCPRSEAGRRRRDCPECVAEVALDAALPRLLAAIRAVDELHQPWYWGEDGKPVVGQGEDPNPDHFTRCICGAHPGLWPCLTASRLRSALAAVDVAEATE